MKLFDHVEILINMDTSPRGWRGVVVDVLEPDGCCVEFFDDEDNTIAATRGKLKAGSFYAVWRRRSACGPRRVCCNVRTEIDRREIGGQSSNG
jgi:hypothetical protein